LWVDFWAVLVILVLFVGVAFCDNGNKTSAHIFLRIKHLTKTLGDH
jgi:hypothetical protein